MCRSQIDCVCILCVTLYPLKILNCFEFHTRVRKTLSAAGLRYTARRYAITLYTIHGRAACHTRCRNTRKYISLLNGTTSLTITSYGCARLCTYRVKCVSLLRHKTNNSYVRICCTVSGIGYTYLYRPYSIFAYNILFTRKYTYLYALMHYTVI